METEKLTLQAKEQAAEAQERFEYFNKMKY